MDTRSLQTALYGFRHRIDINDITVSYRCFVKILQTCWYFDACLSLQCSYRLELVS